MKVAIVFPGYGSQFIGMGKELYDDSRIMQEYFEIAAHCLNENVVKLCFASSDAELRKIPNGLIALFLVSSSLYAYLQEQEGIQPDVVAGFGFGQYSALFAAGSINLPDGLYLLRKYASFYEAMIDQRPVKSFRVLNFSSDDLHTVCTQSSVDGEQVFISAYVAPGWHTISGDAGAVDRVIEHVKGIKGVKVKERPVVPCLYSSMMNEVAKQLSMYLEKVDFKDLAMPLINTATANQLTKGDEVKASILDHLTHPILWTETMPHLVDADLIVEIGPGSRLSEIIQSVYPDAHVLPFGTNADLEKIQEYLATH